MKFRHNMSSRFSTSVKGVSTFARKLYVNHRRHIPIRTYAAYLVTYYNLRGRIKAPFIQCNCLMICVLDLELKCHKMSFFDAKPPASYTASHCPIMSNVNQGTITGYLSLSVWCDCGWLSRYMTNLTSMVIMGLLIIHSYKITQCMIIKSDIVKISTFRAGFSCRPKCYVFIPFSVTAVLITPSKGLDAYMVQSFGVVWTWSLGRW